jgi:hypothetical protein
MSIQGHSLQFYSDDTVLMESMTRFIKEGLQVNDTVIVVATAQHREKLHKALTPEQMAHDKLRFFDAEEQLWKFMVNDWPSESRFRHVMGSMTGQARQKGQVRIFGELAAVLWAEGHTRAALRLEDLWNKLATEQPFSLMHAYPHSAFISKEDP